MKKTLITSILGWGVIWAATAFGATYEPCSPVFIAGPQGRPIPNNTVQITDLSGAAVITWNDAAGVAQFTNVLPANQILQVFAPAGIYIVNIAGDGLTKQYQMVCGEFYGGDAKRISIDRTADVLLDSPAPVASLACPILGIPCYRIFSIEQTRYASFDFILPSFPLTLEEMRLSYRATDLSQSGNVNWRVSSCVYSEGQVPCIPQIPTSSLGTSTMIAGNGRTDYVVPLPPSWIWPVNGHVVMRVAREPTNPQLNTDALLENIRLTFKRP